MTVDHIGYLLFHHFICCFASKGQPLERAIHFSCQLSTKFEIWPFQCDWQLICINALVIISYFHWFVYLQGGVAFIIIKGFLKIYLRQQLYNQQMSRIVKDYNEDEAASPSTQSVASTSTAAQRRDDENEWHYIPTNCPSPPLPPPWPLPFTLVAQTLKEAHLRKIWGRRR